MMELLQVFGIHILSFAVPSLPKKNIFESAILGLIFFKFVVPLQLINVNYKCLMTGFEPGSSV